MHRVLSSVLLAGWLAGCADVGLPPPDPAPAAAQLRVRFGGVADTIEVAAVERLPLRAAELVAPDGTATPARSIEAVASPHVAVGQWAQSNPWHNPLTGGGALDAFASRNPQAGAALRSQQQLLAIVSNAEIALPDQVAYRRDWASYRIRLIFGTPPSEVETREIPAPAPPPR